MTKRNRVLDDIARSLSKRVQTYTSQRVSVQKRLSTDLTIPAREAQANRAVIVAEVAHLSELFETRVFPLVKQSRKHVPDILARDERAACYWLIGKVANNWRAVFLLAKEGMHYEVMECMRSIHESIWLSSYFIIGNPSELAKWFNGEIVNPGKTRKHIHTWMNEEAKNLGQSQSMPIEEVLSGMYAVLSRYSHSSYAAMLDCYEAWHDDFDFDRMAAFHYLVTTGLPYMHSSLRSTVNGLIHFFQYCDDHENRSAASFLYREL